MTCKWGEKKNMTVLLAIGLVLLIGGVTCGLLLPKEAHLSSRIAGFFSGMGGSFTAISLVVLAVVALVLGVFPTWRTLLAIVPLINLFLLSIGAGMILATIGVYFRDMEYLWTVALMLIMYTCAIFYYPKKILNSNVSWILKFNPLFCIINNFRNCVFGRAMSAHMLIYSFIFAFVCIVIGMAVFNKKQDQFILHL